MAVAINGSGTITGISVGGIPDGVVDTDVLANNAVTFGKIGSTEQGQLCKAWVNFDGTGTVAIRASYNVSSITDNGVGLFTVNFTAALPDGNYTMTASTGNAGSTTAVRSINPEAAFTAASCSIRCVSVSSTATDDAQTSVVFFR